MIILAFIRYNLNEKPQEYTYGGPDLESGLDMLTGLINRGWQLTNIRLLNSDKSITKLPVEIFDGISFKTPLKKLQQEWEDALLFKA